MPGGISIEWDPGSERRKRQQQAVQMAQDLMTKGLEPQAINDAVNGFVKTGQMNIPSMQTKALPFDPSVPEGRSTQIPVQFAKKKGLFTLSSDTGQVNQVDTPEGMTDYDVKTISRTPQPKSTNTNKGHTFKIDRATGEQEDMGENGRTYNDYTYWDSRANRPTGGGKDPEDELAKDTLKKYQAAVLRGDDIPDEFMDSARSAADRLKIDMTEVQKDPGALDTLLGVASKATGGRIPAPKPKFGGTSPRFNPKEGRPLTKDQAQKFLQQAGGDKNKARGLAKAAGYTF